ncbi:MAG: hypothetical protein HOL01_23960 [Planctomycetaceae bacterium]|jgi:hypothetical protein|nr:hypothetical protein [Planctomycetaceae bacterium]
MPSSIERICWHRTLLTALIVLPTTLARTGPIQAAEKVTLNEPVTDSRVYRVDHQLNVSGQLETAAGGGKSRTLELKVAADHRFRERRLSGTGRGPAALRSLRDYDTAQAKIVVAGQTSSSRLRANRRRSVAQGRRDGVVSYSPTGSMTSGEVELLEVPADSLALLALLPLNPIEVGDTWEPASWAVQMLTGTEAILKSKLTCKLDKVASDTAHVSFNGSIEGATDGASTEIKLTGNYQFDLKRGFIKQAEMTQTEKRTVGAVSPGMNIEAKVILKRQLAKTPGPLTTAAVEQIPLEPPESAMQLTLQTPWNVRLNHGRDWSLFHQSGDTAVLRLLDAGSLIAQCNMTHITSAAAGKHTSEEQFQNDVRQALGKRLKTITKAEQLEVTDGRFLYRVTAVGESNGVQMHWFYYLCAAPSGQQVTFVFAVETKLLKQLANRDLKIVSTIEFLTTQPTRSANKRD